MRINLTQKFLLPTIIFFALVATVLGLVVTNVLESAMTDRAKTFVADIVVLQAKKYFPDPTYFEIRTDSGSLEKYDQFFESVKTNEVVRIKMWSKNATIVYSDDKDIIGKSFPDNKPLMEALGGNVSAEIVEPTDSEKASERAFKQLMEMYTPIYFLNSTKPAGVIELYYGLDSLNRSISFASQLVYLLIITAFLAMTLLFLVLTRSFIISPLARISTGIKEIEKGNFENKITIKSGDELGKLSVTLNEMTAGLKRLRELKDEFVFVAAHELRAPVTAIKGYISMVQDYPGLTLPSEVKEDLNVVAQSAQRLNQLVNDILEIARSDAGRLEISVSECNLGEIVQQVTAELTPLIKEKQLTMNYTVGSNQIKVKADATRLKEVFVNLVSNAIKYNNKGGYITISHSTEDELVSTQVENSGAGIPDEEQKHIFEKFYRTNSAKTSNTTGTGLGLFITKELVERMNGKISFTSESGVATRFIVDLPKWE